MSYTIIGKYQPIYPTLEEAYKRLDNLGDEMAEVVEISDAPRPEPRDWSIMYRDPIGRFSYMCDVYFMTEKEAKEYVETRLDKEFYFPVQVILPKETE